jgi:hypothetical protein
VLILSEKDKTFKDHSKSFYKKRNILNSKGNFMKTIEKKMENLRAQIFNIETMSFDKKLYKLVGSEDGLVLLKASDSNKILKVPENMLRLSEPNNSSVCRDKTLGYF